MLWAPWLQVSSLHTRFYCALAGPDLLNSLFDAPWHRDPALQGFLVKTSSTFHHTLQGDAMVEKGEIQKYSVT